jgi:hypothetical protein
VSTNVGGRPYSNSALKSTRNQTSAIAVPCYCVRVCFDFFRSELRETCSLKESHIAEAGQSRVRLPSIKVLTTIDRVLNVVWGGGVGGRGMYASGGTVAPEVDEPEMDDAIEH